MVSVTVSEICSIVAIERLEFLVIDKKLPDNCVKDLKTRVFFDRFNHSDLLDPQGLVDGFLKGLDRLPNSLSQLMVKPESKSEVDQ